jgi:ribosomal protein S2
MAQYIFTERNGIYIIDLQKTVARLTRPTVCARLALEASPSCSSAQEAGAGIH